MTSCRTPRPLFRQGFERQAFGRPTQSVEAKCAPKANPHSRLRSLPFLFPASPTITVFILQGALNRVNVPFLVGGVYQSWAIAVGMLIAEHPPHRSRRA